MALDDASTMTATIVASLSGNGWNWSNNPETQEFIQAICAEILIQLKTKMVVTSSGADPQGGSVTSTSTVVS